jgi:hypothetical protein
MPAVFSLVLELGATEIAPDFFVDPCVTAKLCRFFGREFSSVRLAAFLPEFVANLVNAVVAWRAESAGIGSDTDEAVVDFGVLVPAPRVGEVPDVGAKLIRGQIFCLVFGHGQSFLSSN